MTGVELLRETQRVVDPRLLVHQNQLTELKEQYATASKELEKNADMLEEKTRRLRGMERDVERYREKQQVEERALLLEVALPYAQYTAAKNKHDAKKIEKNAAKEKLDALKDQNAPLEAQREWVASLGQSKENKLSEEAVSHYLPPQRYQGTVQGDREATQGHREQEFGLQPRLQSGNARDRKGRRRD